MTDFIEIRGGVPLEGEVQISGAKNAALPMLLASLLTSQPCEFENVPGLEDIRLTLLLLEHFGARVEQRGLQASLESIPKQPESKVLGRASTGSSTSSLVRVHTPQLAATEASYSLVRALRASFWVLAPLLARGGAARVALPGGDIIGARPVDLHLAALESMGAEIRVKHGVVLASAPGGLRGTRVHLRFPSVGATHQVVMAASLAKGTTYLDNAAREPEVVALCEMINQMGGSIEGAGSSQIVVQGVRELGPANVRIIGDRIEAGTYLLAAAATRGRVRVHGIDPLFLPTFLETLQEMGFQIETTPNSIQLSSPATSLRPVSVSTAPFPGLATDLQAPLMAALCTIPGESRIEENVFEGRFGHVSELCRMGAQISVSDRLAVIHGVHQLTSAEVESHDIRAAAAVVIAALAAEGTSIIHEPQHLRRGYTRLEEKLQLLGGQIHARSADVDDYVFAGC